MAIVLAENFKGLGLAAGVNYNTQDPKPYGACPGVYALITTGATMVGKTDIINVEVANGKSWLAPYNAGHRVVGPLTSSLGIAVGNSTIVIGARFRAQVPQAGIVSAFPVFRLIGTNFIYNVPAGVAEFYAELVINRETGTVELWIDNKLNATWPNLYQGTNLTTLRNNGADFYFGLGSVAYFMHTDVLIIYDAGDDGINTRTGPVDISSVPLKMVSSQGFNVDALTDVLTRKDYATDSGTRVKGAAGSVPPELKMTKADGYVLPNDTPVLGTFVVAKSNYTVGQPGDLKVTHKRGPSTKEVTAIQPPVLPVLPNLLMGVSSRSAAEQTAATAMDGLEISLKVADR
jgi:hypothetical protein